MNGDKAIVAIGTGEAFYFSALGAVGVAVASLGEGLRQLSRSCGVAIVAFDRAKWVTDGYELQLLIQRLEEHMRYYQ